MVHRCKRLGIVFVQSEIWRSHYAPSLCLQAGARLISLSHQCPWRSKLMVRYGTRRIRQQQGDVVELRTNLKGVMMGSAFGSTRGAWLGNPAPSAPASLSSEAQPWGFTTALFEFYWGRCGVVGATCSGPKAYPSAIREGCAFAARNTLRLCAKILLCGARRYLS